MLVTASSSSLLVLGVNAWPEDAPIFKPRTSNEEEEAVSRVESQISRITSSQGTQIARSGLQRSISIEEDDVSLAGSSSE